MILDTELRWSKSLGIIFNKVDRYIRMYDKTRYFSLLYSKKIERIFDRIRYLRLKSNISSINSHNTKIKIESDDNLLYYA